MFNSGPRARPEMRRSQSVHQISSYALTIHRDTSDSENSVSDLSLDTCFHPNSGHGNSDSENEDNDDHNEKEEEKEENANKEHSNDSENKEDETSDFQDDSDPELAQDSTHVHQYRRRRGHHGDNEDAALKSMIVTSFRSPKIASKRKVAMRRPSQVDDFDAATSFRLDSTILDRRRRLLMTRVESLHNPETNAQPRTVTRKLERGSSSMRNLSIKSREFEDLLGTVTDRDEILQDMDPFLSGDDDPTHHVKSLRRKSSKRSTTTVGTTRTTSPSRERNQVNNKQIVLAYDGQEGNLFPEISREEKAKFQGCGNDWLEGKYSTTADWKRDATGMMLELNITSKSDRKNRRKSKDDIIKDVHRSSSHDISTNHEKDNEDDISLPGECYDVPLQNVISDKDESESVTSNSRSRQRTSTGDFSATRDYKSLKHRSSSSSHKKQPQSKDRSHRTKANRTDRRIEGRSGGDEQSDDGSISLAAETTEKEDSHLRRTSSTSKSRTHHTTRKFKQPQRRISFESINTVPSITESWNAEDDNDNNDKEEVNQKKKEKKQSDSHKFKNEDEGDYQKSTSPRHGIPRKMRSMEETSSSYPVASNPGSEDAPTSRNSRSSPRRSSYHHPEQQPKSNDIKSNDIKVSSSRRRSDSDGVKKMRSKSADDNDDVVDDSKPKETMRKNRTKVLERKPSNSLDSTAESKEEKVSSSRHSKKSPMRSDSKSQKMEKRNEKDEDDLVKKSKSSKTSPNRTSKEKVVESDMREKLRLSNQADRSPRKDRRLKEQSSPRRDQLPKHTESDLDTSTGAETSRRRRSDTSNQLSDTSGRKASSRSKDEDDIELSNSNFSKAGLTSPSENNPKDETLKADKKQRRRRRSTSVPRNAVDKAATRLEKELLGTEYGESRKSSNRDDDKGMSKPSPMEGFPSVSSDVQDVELTQRLRNSNTTDIPNSTHTARNAFSQPRRSSSLPRGAEAALRKSIETPNHDNPSTLRSRNSIRRGSHHQRRRSSSQPRNAEDAFRKSNEYQESQQQQHSRARTKDDQNTDRYRSTSVPRDETMRDAAAAAAAAVIAEERNRQRRESHSKSSHKRRSSSLPRGVENKHQQDRNASSSEKTEMASLASAGPPVRRRLSIGGSTYDEPSEDNEAPRPRRRRSLTVGGEVITSGTGEDHPPPTPIRKQNESHQYVQFEEVVTSRISLPTASLVSMAMNPNKQTSKGSANSNNGSGKPSFLARFASRFEAETIKPLEKRASMIKHQQQEILPRTKIQDNRTMDRSGVGSTGGGGGAVTSERVVSHQQQMPSTNTTTSKYTPTVTDVPIGIKGTSTYSDLVMQGKIGMMVSNHDTELQE